MRPGASGSALLSSPACCGPRSWALAVLPVLSVIYIAVFISIFLQLAHGSGARRLFVGP